MKAKQTVFRLTLRSTPKSIRRVEAYLNKINTSVGLDEIQMHKLMVSITEAVNNAIIHGNKSDPKKHVTLVVRIVARLAAVSDKRSGQGVPS